MCLSGRILRVAAVQMNSGTDESANVEAAFAAVEAAASAGARLVVLPELFHYMGAEAERSDHAHAVPGPLSDRLASVASRCALTLVAGSILERSQDPKRCYNTSLVFSPEGVLVARYRKQHLFDVDLPDGPTARESACYLPGAEDVVVPAARVTLGLAICFDLRYPELFLRLRELGAQVIVVPSAFTERTGEAHWELLVRTRALDTQCFLIAANQCGEHPGSASTFGHTMVVDPWGTVVAKAGVEPEVLVADINLARVQEVRRMLPMRGEGCGADT